MAIIDFCSPAIVSASETLTRIWPAGVFIFPSILFLQNDLLRVGLCVLEIFLIVLGKRPKAIWKARFPFLRVKWTLTACLALWKGHQIQRWRPNFGFTVHHDHREVVFTFSDSLDFKNRDGHLNLNWVCWNSGQILLSKIEHLELALFNHGNSSFCGYLGFFMAFTQCFLTISSFLYIWDAALHYFS